MLLKNLDILLQQDLVIIYFVCVNMTSVLSFNSAVFLAEATTKITNYFYISFDVLIRMISCRILQELSPKKLECSMKKLPLGVLWFSNVYTAYGYIPA